jgi:hypothetical protein
MGRIITVVTVWLDMVAMMLIIALPVIGKTIGFVPGQGGPPFRSGNGHPGTSSDVIHSDEGACVTHKGDTTGTGKETGGGCPEVT